MRSSSALRSSSSFFLFSTISVNYLLRCAGPVLTREILISVCFLLAKDYSRVAISFLFLWSSYSLSSSLVTPNFFKIEANDRLVTLKLCFLIREFVLRSSFLRVVCSWEVFYKSHSLFTSSSKLAAYFYFTAKVITSSSKTLEVFPLCPK